MAVSTGARASRSAISATAGEDESVSEQVSREVFTTYECRSIDRGIVHPGDIAEPSSLSAISLPQNDYPIWDSVGDEIVNKGKLSRLQLEGVRYACQKHLDILPSGQRAGFFIGDGAGVGKGRQIAGIILDNYCRGRVKHVWVSTSTDLHADACRDVLDLGIHIKVINNCQDLDSATLVGGLSKDYAEGILFLTYSTLVSAGRGKQSRLQQVLEWLGGPEFDGCLIFDECHRAKNYVPGKEGQSTKVAAAVIELQRLLPMARAVYCSATGVSEVGHMAYMERMGLWGTGSPFPDFEAFLDIMRHRGVSFLEMLAMELKSEGKYVARGLSFRAAEFLHQPCKLSDSQMSMYNAAADMWQEVRSELATAMTLTGASNDAWRTFWAAQQRFFKLLCVSMKVPAVVALAKEALVNGSCVVIGLQSTGESAADFVGLVPGQIAGFVSVTKEILRRFVQTQFPVARNVKIADVEAAAKAMASTSRSLHVGADSKPLEQSVQVPECVEARKRLLEDIEDLDLPPHFLDELIDQLGGPEQVAEMTGRSARVVKQGGRLVYTTRGKADAELDSLNMSEKDQFMSGKKLVAIISDAASTGISLHAVRGAKNTARRVHITIELPWSADKAIQQLGRSHRSNQVSAPLYQLVTTNVGGESRFAAAVARRLQSLGALTRGDRRAASGIDLSEQNLDTPLGRSALRTMYDLIIMREASLPAGVTLSHICKGVDVKEAGVPQLSKVLLEESPSQAVLSCAIGELHASLQQSVDLMGVGSNVPRLDTVGEDKAGLSLAKSAKELGDVRRFLNRLLGLPVHRQNLLFNYFSAVMQAEIRAAKAEGRYSEGMSDLPASQISRELEPQTLWVDPHSGLKTVRNNLRVDRGVSFERALQRLASEAVSGDGSGFYVSKRPIGGKTLVLLAIARPFAGNMYNVCRPNTGLSFFDMERVELTSRYTAVDPHSAKSLWDDMYESCLTHCMHGPACSLGASCNHGRRITTVTILTGSIVRVWGVLEQVLKRHEHSLNKADRSMRIIRVDMDSEGALIGVRYKEALLPEVVAMLSTLQTASKGTVAATMPAAISTAYGHAIEQQARAAGGSAVVQRNKQEAVTAINSRLRTKLFTPPRTIQSFFGKITIKTSKPTPVASLATASCSISRETNMLASGLHLPTTGNRSIDGKCVIARVTAGGLTVPVPLSDVVDLCDSMDAPRGLPPVTTAAVRSSEPQPAHQKPALGPHHGGCDAKGSALCKEEAKVRLGGVEVHLNDVAEEHAACLQHSDMQATVQAKPCSSDMTDGGNKASGKRPRSSDENGGEPLGFGERASRIGPQIQGNAAAVLGSQDLNGKEAAAPEVERAEGVRQTKARCLHEGVSGGALGIKGEGGKAFTRDEILAMGFKRTDVDVALKVTGNDGARAIEYLLTR